MSTEKSPEQIAEDSREIVRIANDVFDKHLESLHDHFSEEYIAREENSRYALTGHYSFAIRYYRDHVLNRPIESETMRDLLKRVRDHQYAAMDPNFEILRSMYIATMREWGDVLEAHLSTSTPPVTVDGIMEVVQKWHAGEDGWSELRSRLESYLTPNTKH